MELIEEIINQEFKGICSNCLHADTCTYYKSSSKSIIQCELYVLDTNVKSNVSAGGLCRTCSKSASCKLPGRQFGVWHCDTYKDQDV